MSEQSSVRKGVGYDEVFQWGHKPQGGLSLLLEREASAHSPNEEVESCDVKEGEVEVDEGEDECDERGQEGEDDGRTLESAQEALEMGTPIHLSSPKYGPLMTLSERW